MRRTFSAVLALLLAAALALPAPVAARERYDVLIRNGRIIDGSGNPWYAGDVGIRKGRIVAVGRLADATARRVIDAGGRVVAPGFIDVHAHAEGNIHRVPTAESFLFDGVTAIVTGNCGGSETDVRKFFGELRRHKVSLNVATLIGHNSVRRAVMGSDDRDPTADEQRRMEELVDRAMREGAVGFATGLIYIPGTYSKTEEVVALARAAARHGGVYASHIRSEGDKIFEAIDEAIAVGRDAGMPVQISHFKLSNKLFWGRSAETIQRVRDARAAGLDVTVDQYPYTASSTNLGVRLPSWALAGGQERIRERLADPATRRKIAEEMYSDFTERQGRTSFEWAVVASCGWDESLNGKNISEINRERGRAATFENEIETVLEMMERGGCGMVYHVMAEEDVARILQFPYTMVASDAGVREFGRGMGHPRAYGTRARVLGRYVREQQVIALEDAVRRMTSLPAQRFGLADRGLLRPGMWADVVIFDPATVADRATFDAPHAYSVGFTHVLVNGELVIENGRHTGARPGQPLFGPAKR